jgi:hypothetical protein
MPSKNDVPAVRPKKAAPVRDPREEAFAAAVGGRAKRAARGALPHAAEPAPPGTSRKSSATSRPAWKYPKTPL